MVALEWHDAHERGVIDVQLINPVPGIQYGVHSAYDYESFLLLGNRWKTFHLL